MKRETRAEPAACTAARPTAEQTWSRWSDRRAPPPGAGAVGAGAMGALAVGARGGSDGALAIGRLAIGRLGDRAGRG